MGLIDTTPKIAEYGKFCNRSGQGLTKDVNWCYTEYYDLEYSGSQYICDNNTSINHTFQYQTNAEGTAWDYWYGPRRSVMAHNVIRFSIRIDSIDDAYAYSEKTGQIFFAGKNSLYYGYANINDMVSNDTASLVERRRQILLNTPHLITESANPLTFQTDILANLKDCKIYFEPIQEGSGDPSPDNVRPISGWDGIELYHNGENLLPRTLPSTAFSGTFATGSTSIGSATNAKVWTIYVGKNQKLRYRRDSDSSTTIQFAFSDTELTSRTGAVIYNAVNCTNRYGYIFDSGEHPYLVTGIANSSQLGESAQLDASHAMISFGSETKWYAKRTDVLKMPIQFPQTIYGGYVDLVKGELVQEWGIVDLGTLTWNYNSSRKMFQTNFTSATSSPRKVICDHYKTVDSDYDKVDKTISLVQWTYPNGQINVSDYSFDGDTAAFKTAMNGVMAAYKMRSPITHQLTLETIKTLKGVNSIWSNANGNIEVKFWKH